MALAIFGKEKQRCAIVGGSSMPKEIARSDTKLVSRKTKSDIKGLGSRSDVIKTIGGGITP